MRVSLDFKDLDFNSILDIDQALIKLPIIDRGCPTTFAREWLDLNVTINTNDDISLEFKAFNWKHGGQVYVVCEFSICENCEQDCTGRHRREVVRLEAKMIGHGQVTHGFYIVRWNFSYILCRTTERSKQENWCDFERRTRILQASEWNRFLCCRCFMCIGVIQAD